MKSFSVKKRLLSMFIAMVIAVGMITPAFTALAGGVVGYYEIQLFYDNGVIVPEEDSPEVSHVEYLMEGEKLQLNYQFIDCELPDNGYIKWYSETPTLVDVDANGLVKAFDSSKGAVVHTWINNEVKTVPLIGSIMGAALEKALFNEYVNVDTMDTDSIIKIVETTIGEDSVFGKYFDSYGQKLIDSLRYYLDHINSNIHVTMYDADGTELADDYVQICVTKSDKIYADFLPNGTHITNKQNIETTVAKGSEVQLYACTTPTRLNMGVVYSVKSSSIFTQGNVVATVNDSGLVSFKNTGTVTIVVSPDTEGFINNLLKLINYFYALDNTGTLDTDKIAGILIDYVGIDMNRAVLAAILDTCFAIYDIAQSTADPVQLTATAVKIISNIVLQFVYNDKITFTVVDGVPCTDFTIDGANTVKEGTQIQLGIKDAKPVAADTSDITWSSSDESVAYVDPVTGVITGRDAGGSLGSLSQKTVVITATSAANNVQKSFNLTVTGKTGRYLSDVVIEGEKNANIGAEQDLTYIVYPSRVASADNLYLEWGVITQGTDADSYQYLWATDPYDQEVTDDVSGETVTVHHDGTASDGIGKIDKNGHYTAVAGGTAKIALKAKTGYYIKDDTFYEISSVIGVIDIFNGLPVDSISLTATDTTSGGKLTTNDVTVNDDVYHYATVKKTVADAYYLNGAKLSANVLPLDATNKKVIWHCDNSDYYFDKQDDSANTVQIKMKAAVEAASSVNVWCESQDGEVKSDVITVCVTRNYATGNAINTKEISVTNGKTADASHTMTFSGSWTSDAYACYDCNWYSGDENVFTVANKGDSNSNAVITGVDVGTATLYCVSADGGIMDTATVNVYPDKEYLRSIVRICEDTVIKRTDQNKSLYKDFSKKLDYAYYVLNDEPMASQNVCDTYAQELLYSFYKLGGYIGLNGISITKKDSTVADDYLSVNVSTTNYKNTSYTLGYLLSPKNAMYQSISWSSSNSSVNVDRSGKCTPTSNDACWSIITCTATDYMGSVFTDSVYIAFTKTPVTGISLNTTAISGGKVGETSQLTATVSPTGTLGVGKASVQDLVWTSSDESVATVDGSGVVTFMYGGDCVITASSCDGGYSASCNVNVVTNYDALKAQIETYQALNLISTNYYPDTWEAYQKAIDASNALIAQNASSQPEVNEQLNKLIASYQGLKKYNYINQVEIYLDGEAASDFYQYDLALLSDGISYKNAKLDLNVRLYPNNASYADVKWSSSTSDITITDEGVATPTTNKSCYGQITCTVTDHFGQTWTDNVWVSYAYVVVTGVKLSETAIAGPVGSTRQLTATIEPTGTSLLHTGAASIKDYYWESDNEDIATVDSSGLVTFVSAGTTTVRAVSYDGGIKGECSVSTNGDRNALKAAIEQYKNIDYRDYEYSYGTAFKTAYDRALAVMDDISLSQVQIDNATAELNSAGEALAGHEIIQIKDINVSWTGYRSSSQKGSGSISKDTNNLSIDMTNGGYNKSLHYTNSVVLSASAAPAGADAKTIVWQISDTHNMKGEISNQQITLTPTKTIDDSWAKVKVTVTDSYGRAYVREMSVIMAEYTVTGITLDQTSMSMTARDAARQINASLSTTGSTDFKQVSWTSDNESVATVDQNGAVTPHEIGTAKITATTFDGGYKAVCDVTVTADYSAIEAAYAKYNTLITDVEDDFVYTPDSLAVLQQTVSAAKTIIDEYRSTQAEVDAAVTAMNTAYNSLVRYIIADGIDITVDTAAQSNVTADNDGFIRYENAVSINGKSIQLAAKSKPEGGLYSSIEWSSSNSNIFVDETGLCKNDSANPGYAVITCTITTVKGLSFTDSVYVSFARYGVKSVSFTPATIYGSVQSSTKLTPTIETSSVISSLIIQDCIYKSSDESVATVDDNGTVTFVSQGQATITATACDGGAVGIVTAYTTWDMSALNAAITSARALQYTDYAYEYGTAFKTAYDNAVEVAANYSATQEEIDAACYNLTTAQGALAGHEFIAPGDISIINNAQSIENNTTIVVDANSQAVLSVQYQQGAMVGAVEWSIAGASNVSAQVNSDKEYVLTKPDENAVGTATITAKFTDDYGREYLKTILVKLVNEKVSVSSIVFTYNNQEITAGNFSCGGVYTGKSFQLGFNTYPVEADGTYSSVTWESTNSSVKVSDNGAITASGIKASYTADIICTVTFADGTVVTASIPVTITRA